MRRTMLVLLTVVALAVPGAAANASAPALGITVTARDVTVKLSGATPLPVAATLTRALTSSERAVVILDEEGLPETAEPVTYVVPAHVSGRSVSATASIPAKVGTSTWSVAAVVVPTSAKNPLDIDSWKAFAYTEASVLAVSVLTFNAAPEPVAPGEKITASGTVSFRTPRGSFTARSNVWLYFDPTGPGKRRFVRSLDTNASGRFSTQVTATTSGVWSVRLEGSPWGAPVTSHGDRVEVVRKKTRLTANAAPEPIRRGATLTVAGRLTHATSVRGVARYTSYQDKTLTISFNPTGPKGATKVATVTTNAEGEYSKKVTQSVDGTWWVSFAGTSNYVAALKGDHVDVR
jgi:hypothetical protein